MICAPRCIAGELLFERGNMLTVTQFSGALGCSVRRARELCAAGLPGVTRLGRAWIVTDEFAAIAAARMRCTRRGPKPRTDIPSY